MQPEKSTSAWLRRHGGWVLFLSVNAALFGLLLRRPPEITIDTPSYLQHAITRTPGYPLFLDLMGLLGRGHKLKLAQLVQLALGFLAAFHLAWTLRRCLGLGALLGAVIYALLLVPQVRFGPIICTEPLSYPLFLLLLAQVCRSFFEVRNRQVLAAAALLFLLLLVRPQFIFLCPLVLLYLGWLLSTRRRLVDNAACALCLAAAISGSLLAQAANNYVYSGRFARIPFTGIQVLSVVIYFSGPADVAHFSDEKEVRYLTALFDKLEEKRWLAHHRPQFRSLSEHFGGVYAETCYAAVVPGFLPIFGSGGGQELGPEGWVAMDAFTLRIAGRLILLHKKEFAFHVLKQIQEAGGYLPVLMLLMIALGALCYRRTGAAAALLPVTVGLMGWCNYLLVSLVEPLGTRYIIYTENVQLPILLAFVAHVARPWLSVALGPEAQRLQHDLQQAPLVHNEIA